MYSKRNMVGVGIRKILIVVTKNLARPKSICIFLLKAKSAYTSVEERRDAPVFFWGGLFL